MRYTALSLILCLAFAGLAPSQTPNVSYLPKVEVAPLTPQLEPREGGETIEDAVVIPDLPFFDSGNTCTHIDDYEEMCPYSSTSPDVVYSFTPEYDTCIWVSLCDSYYDTKVFVYEDYVTPGVPYACNDDNFYCYEPPVPYTSWIEWMEVFAGHTYYIVVDGYAGACGDYELGVVTCGTIAPIECPPEGIDEGEGPCYDGYDDYFNGGCNTDPEIFWEVAPSPDPIVICGMGGNYDNNTMRDTDWYLLDLTCGETTITVCLETEFPGRLGMVDLREGCENVSSFYSTATAPMGHTVCLTETLPAGEWVIWVGTWDWPDYPCDGYWIHYNLTIEGYDSCVPVEDASWSTIKAIYR